MQGVSSVEATLFNCLAKGEENMKKKPLIALLTIIVIMLISFVLPACATSLQDGHTHTFSNEWSYDEEYHWHAATCEHKDQISSRAAHTFKNDICTVCAYQRDDSTEPTEKEYRTVSFVLNGGNGSLENMQFAVGEIMSSLPSPTRSGYVFVGWKTELGSEYDTTSVMPDTNIILYAQWEKEVDSYEDQYVSFKPATEGTKDDETSHLYPIINKFVYVEMTSDDIGGPSAVGEEGNFDFVSGVKMDYFVKDGYSIQWYYDETFALLNGAQIFTLDYGSNFQFLTVSDGQRVVQRYLVDFYIKQDYYIDLYTNIYASTPYDTVRVIENNTLPSDTPIKEVGDYEFDKRVYMNINTGKWTEFNYSTLINNDWALFQTYKPYTLNANLDGGTLDGELELIPYTEKQELAVPYKEGYDFLGWQNPDASDATTMLFTDMYGYSDLHYIGKTNSNDYNQFDVEELTAVWKPKEYYRLNNGDKVTFAETTPKITYVNDRNTTISQIDYIYINGDMQITVDPENLYAVGDKVAARENNGYTLIGWYDEAGVKLSENGSFEFIMPEYNENAVYTMKWQPCAVVLLTNGDNKGSVLGLEQITTVVGGEASVTAEAKPLYVFAGWYDEQNNLLSNDVTYTFIMPEMSVTFTAVFEYMSESDTSDFTFVQNSESSYTIKSYTGNATSVVVPDMYNGLPVTVIGEDAFYNNTDLLGVDIPESITKIENNAFYNCRALTVINFDVINCEDLYRVENNILYLNKIFSYAGQDGEGITVNIGASVTNIPAYLFCSSDATDSPKIISVNFEEGSVCESIGTYAFGGCSDLTKIAIPKSITSIGGNAFYNCNNLEAVYITDLEAWCNISFSNDDSNPLVYADNLYLNDEIVTELIIPDGVTSIGSFAFYDCVNLTSITIPESVTNIGDYAFYGCTALTEINFNATNCGNLTSGNRAFSNVGQDGDGITVNIGAKVTRIPAYLFCPYSTNSSNSPKIISVNFAEKSVCESIENLAFSNCNSLTSISIPESVTNIGRSAFFGCTALTEINFNATNCSDLVNNNQVFSYAGQNGEGITVNIGANTTKIPAYLFFPYSTDSSYLPNIASVHFAKDSTCTSIGSFAFRNCSGLTSITIPDNVTSIGRYAFSGCSGLTDIIIPESVTSIGDFTFSGCSSLESITLPFVGGSIKTADDTYQYPFGYIFGTSSFTGGVATRQNYYGSNISSTTYDTYYIPSSLKKVTITGGNILYGAFENCGNLTSITIPESVTSIGERAFYNCSGLTNITIPESVTYIGRSAFYGCTALQYNEYESALYLGNENNPYIVLVKVKDTSLIDYTINQNAKFIYANAFSDCRDLTSITIPESMTSIGEDAFNTCSRLNSVYITDLNKWCNISFGNSSANPLHYAGNLYLNGDLATEIVIPDGVTEIKDYTFYNCSSLTSIAMPESVTSIGEDAFYGCKNLTSITIPKSVTSIGSSAFYGCSSLINITIPESVTSIGAQVFSGCSSLTNINVNEYNAIYCDINGVLFSKDKATLICYPAGKIAIQYYIPEGVVSIGDSAFYDCSNLTGVIIPEGVKSIGSSAFYGCSGLISISIPEGVTSIGNSAFSECSSLTHITIPEGAKSIGGFYGCSNLFSITIPKSVIGFGFYDFTYCSSLRRVYYTGTWRDWTYNTTGTDNAYLKNATIYYYSETEPTGTYNYWHYAEDGVTIVIWPSNSIEE